MGADPLFLLQKPDPLVPEGVSTSGFPTMPLDVGRLLASDTWVEAADVPKLGHALVSLWAAAWMQTPPASLPTNAKTLARLAFCSPSEWSEIAERALAGFVLCNDGRLYHPVIAEKVLWAASRNVHNRARTEKAREAAAARRAQAIEEARILAAAQSTDSVAKSVTESVTDDKVREVKVSEVKVSEVKSIEKQKTPSAEAAGATGNGGELVPTETPRKTAARATWEAYSDAYFERYNAEPVRNKTINSQILSFVDRLGFEAAPEVAAFFLTHKGARYVARMHSVGDMLVDAEKLHTEWQTGQQMTTAAARQSDRTGANVNALNSYIGKLGAGDE